MTALNIKTQRGFTLIELLVVIGILAILLAITLIAINPARQFAQANNTKRQADINAILNAVGQFQADNNGTLPGGGAITTTVQDISDAGADICAALVPQYIAQLPSDPLTGGGAPIASNCPAGYDTGYQIVQSGSDSRITVSAPDTEIPPATADFSVTR